MNQAGLCRFQITQRRLRGVPRGADFVLGSLSLGDVAQHTSKDFFLRGVKEGESHLQREFPAVFGDSWKLYVLPPREMALAGAQIPLEPKCVPAAETLRHNRGQRFSHEFRFCETEHLLGGAVELADQPSLIERD